MPAKAQAEEQVFVDRPARTVREGRAGTLDPQNLGKMTVYTFKDVTDYAYTVGLSRFEVFEPEIKETLDSNGKPQSTAVVRAIAWMWDRDPNTGEWVEKPHYGVGDANAENCNRMVAPHFIRMAETRAKGRALAHALNLDANFAEEMGDTSDTPKNTPARQPATSNPGNKYPKENPSKFPPQNHEAAGESEPGWYCENTGERLKDTAQSSAGRKAQWAVEKTGRILSYEEQQKVLNG